MEPLGGRYAPLDPNGVLSQDGDRHEWSGSRPKSNIVRPSLEDGVTPAATNAELLAAAVPHARLVMLAGCGHLPEVEFPSRVNDLVAAHVLIPGKYITGR